MTTCLPLTLSVQKPIVIFGINDINEHMLFQNGLTQNVIMLYDLFECIGYQSYLLQHAASDMICSYRTISLQNVVKQSMNISLFIEVGVSLDTITRQYLRSIHAKIIKLYLGNILNIDIETVHYFNNKVFFHHHVVGDTDEIWTSPHYAQHVEYAATINRTPVQKSRIVPYVWDPKCLTYYGKKETMKWTAPHHWSIQDIVICDPSISFQKCTFYSLLLVEAFSKQFPEWKGHVHLINGDRMMLSSHSLHHVLPSLTLHQAKRITFHSRKKIHTIMEDHPSACFITHQWNNAYNYMTLELMYCNYPILHNSDGWESYGYHYSINKWDAAIQTLYLALTCHKENINIYQTHTAQLTWKHSIHHPDTQCEWRTILTSL